MNGKIQKINYSTMLRFDDSELLSYHLTRRQAAMLMNSSIYLEWATRWLNLPLNIELDVIRGNVDDALLNPFPIETPMTPQEICTILETCTAFIDLQTDVVNNAAAIALNTTAHNNNQTQISSNISAIDDLETSQLVQDGLIAQLVLDAQQQALTLGSHDSRLTALESATSPTGELSSESVEVVVKKQIFSDAWTNTPTEYELDLRPFNDNWIIIEFYCISDQPAPVLLYMFANRDYNVNNYQTYRTGIDVRNLPEVGQAAIINSDGIRTQTARIEFRHLLQDPKPVAMYSTSAVGNSNAAVGHHRHGSWAYEVGGDVDYLTFRPNAGSFMPLGGIRVYAMRTLDVITSVEFESDPNPPIPVSWDATLDFSTFASLPSIISAPDFVFSPSIGRLSSNPAGASFYGSIVIDGGSSAMWSSVTLDYDHHNNGVDYQSELWLNAVGSGGTLLTDNLDTSDPTGQLFPFTEQAGNDITLWVNMYGLGASSFVGFRKIKLAGSGAIPQSLAQYGQEYFA